MHFENCAYIDGFLKIRSHIIMFHENRDTLIEQSLQNPNRQIVQAVRLSWKEFTLRLRDTANPHVYYKSFFMI